MAAGFNGKVPVPTEGPGVSLQDEIESAEVVYKALPALRARKRISNSCRGGAAKRAWIAQAAVTRRSVWEILPH